MTETGGPSGPEGTETPKPQADAPATAEPSTPPMGEKLPPQQPPQEQWQSPSDATSQPMPPPRPPQMPPHVAQQRFGLGKPGVIPLRPLNLTDILDGAITAMRRYWKLVFGAAAVTAVITAAINLTGMLLVDTTGDLAEIRDLGPAATQQELSNQLLGVLGGTLASTFITLVATLLGTTILTGFLTVLMGRAALGKPVSFKEAAQEAAPRLLPLLGLTVLYTLAILVAAIFCLLPAIVPYTFWALASPAFILERGTVMEAFRRSVKLVSGMFWRVFGILLLAYVISSFLASIITVPFSFNAFLSIFGNLDQVYVPSTGDLILQSVGTVIAQTIVGPFTALVTVILYIDQRMRREGMDIELARAAGITPQPPQAW